MHIPFTSDRSEYITDNRKITTMLHSKNVMNFYLSRMYYHAKTSINLTLSWLLSKVLKSLACVPLRKKKAKTQKKFIRKIPTRNLRFSISGELQCFVYRSEMDRKTGSVINH